MIINHSLPSLLQVQVTMNAPIWQTTWTCKPTYPEPWLSLDTIFANFKHIISLLLFLWAPVHYSFIVFKTLCTQVPEGYFRAMFFRLLQGVQQIGSRIRIKTKGRKQKKQLLVEFIWLAKYCILSWNRNSYPLSFHYFPQGTTIVWSVANFPEQNFKYHPRFELCKVGRIIGLKTLK